MYSTRVPYEYGTLNLSGAVGAEVYGTAAPIGTVLNSLVLMIRYYHTYIRTVHTYLIYHTHCLSSSHFR